MNILVINAGSSSLKYQLLNPETGALLAKGWLLGVQFDALFTDGLYQKLGKNAIETAERLREGFQEKGFSFYLDTPTNQIFLVVDRAQREDLARMALDLALRSYAAQLACARLLDILQPPEGEHRTKGKK